MSFSIRRIAYWSVTFSIVMLLFIAAIILRSFNNTLETLSTFEAKQIPEIRNVLSLSEEVAQIAALAPYIVNSARPFQLQTEKTRLQDQYDRAVAILENIQVEDYRRELKDNLQNINQTLNNLIDAAQLELYLKEDALTLLFELRLQSGAQADAEKVVDANMFLEMLLTPIGQPLDKKSFDLLQRSLSTPGTFSPTQQAIAVKSQELSQKYQQLIEKKTFLLSTLRAQSENLTNQTNYFATLIQQEVVTKQQQVNKDVRRALTIGSSVLFVLMIFIVLGLRFIRNLASDLAIVSQDMQSLARGLRSPERIDIRRNDEIGALVYAYYEFRQRAVSADQTSQLLSAQNSLMATIFESIQDGLSVFSADNRMVTWNRQYLRLFAIAEEELYEGMPLQETQAIMDRTDHCDMDADGTLLNINIVNEKRHWQAQTFERHFSNGRIIEYRSQPMPNGGFVTLYSDITEKRIAEATLRQTQKMEVLGQLTGGVAHDFNNLLAALMGNLQLLERQPLDETAHRYVQRALHVSERGRELLRRLLAFGRKQQLSPEVIHVDEFIRDMEDLFLYSVPASISLKLDLRADDCRVLIDGSQLENAILNLVLNSVDAISRNGEIILSTEQAMGRVVVSVADNGGGIPAQLIERVTEPFFTTKTMGRGSGLGLSTVFGFVTQSGGEFDLQSKPGVGTTVRLSWPVSEQAAVPDRNLLDIPALEFERSKAVLVFEDDKAVAQMFTDLLAREQLQAHAFDNAESGMDWLQHHCDQIGLIISDVNLSGDLNGLDVVEMVNKYYPGLPVILMSGLSRELIEQQYRKKITSLFVQKPLTSTMFGHLFGHCDMEKDKNET